MANVFARILPIALLICSNVFMTFAWYGHLRFKDRPLWLVIVASWGIALFEYCLAEQRGPGGDAEAGRQLRRGEAARGFEDEL